MISFIIQGYHGLGRHQQTLTESDLAGMNEAVYYQSLISAITAFGLLKVSIALFLLRIGKNSPWFSRTLWSLIVFVVAYTIFGFFTFAFRCSPVSGAWNTTIGAKCYSWTFFVGTALANTGEYLHARRDILEHADPQKYATCLPISCLRQYPYPVYGSFRCRCRHV